MCAQLQKSTLRQAQSMSRGQEKMQQVIVQAEQTGAALIRISEAIVQIQVMADKITQANAHQTTVTNEVTSNIKHISELSEKTGRDSEEILKASEELASLAAKLQQETHRFKM